MTFNGKVWAMEFSGAHQVWHFHTHTWFANLSEQILHLVISYAKLISRLGDGQLLHVSEMPGQLSAERSFDIRKKDMIENMIYLQHLCWVSQISPLCSANITSYIWLLKGSLFSSLNAFGYKVAPSNRMCKYTLTHCMFNKLYCIGLLKCIGLQNCILQLSVLMNLKLKHA